MMEIAAPQLLVKLPRTARPDAATHFGNVYTVREGVKRRRREICAAVDGHSLSIYETQDGNTVASFTVPPNSRFFGPPCSIVSRSDGQSHRKTYCAIKRDTLQIESFEIAEDGSNRVKSERSPALYDQDSPVLLIAVLSNNGPDGVLVMQQNGNLTVLSKDIQTVSLQQRLYDSSEKDLNILAIQHLTVSEAQKSVLRQRSDILSNAMPQTSYLAAVYTRTGKQENKRKVCYGVWAVNPAGQDALSKGSSADRVVEHELVLEGKEAIATDLKGKSCNFSPSASNLFLHSGGTLRSYDLTGVVPSLSAALNIGVGGTPEIMALSHAFAISSLGDSFGLYDLKYGSIQAQLDTKRINLKRKRKRMTGEHQAGQVEFITYFSQSTRVIGVRRNQLLAIDISGGNSKEILDKGSNLVHNIGRGQQHSDNGAVPPNNLLELDVAKPTLGTESDPDWQTLRKRLDQLAQAGDVSEFENTFANDIHQSAMNFPSPTTMFDDLPSNRCSIPDSKISYLLSKIFEIDSSLHGNSGDPSVLTRGLKVQIPTFRLLFWLSRLRLLSYQSVQQAIAAASPGFGDEIATNAVAQALLDVDPTRKLLLGCLENGYSPLPEEQGAVLQLLIQQALIVSSDEALSTLDPNPDEGSADTPSKMQVRRLSTSNSESSWLPPLLQRALVVSLDNFGTCAAATISAHIRTSFSQTEVLALIQLLRQQLFQGGHSRSLQSLPITATSDGESSQTVRLDAIIKVLSSCIDAIGPLGFFGTWENEDFIGNIVPDLVTEITHTMQSLDDAAELQGILRETIRYQESIQRHQEAEARVARQDQGRFTAQKAGTIVTLYSESVQGDDGLQAGNGLPLGLKEERVVSPTKMRKGGGQVSKRSARQMTMLERRHRGQYSFERLVL